MEGKGGIALPIRWLSPESLRVEPNGSVEAKKPSAPANVWSFGVALWEVIFNYYLFIFIRISCFSAHQHMLFRSNEIRLV